MRSSKVVAAASVFAALALFIAACTSQPLSLGSVGPSALVGPSILALEGGKGSCSDGLDNDGDKQIDCADTECFDDAACKGGGTSCSPGYWKNHLDHFDSVCVSVGGWTCESLLAALNCKGSDATCRRSEAAAALSAIEGCTE